MPLQATEGAFGVVLAERQPSGEIGYVGGARGHQGPVRRLVRLVETNRSQHRAAFLPRSNTGVRSVAENGHGAKPPPHIIAVPPLTLPRCRHRSINHRPQCPSWASSACAFALAGKRQHGKRAILGRAISHTALGAATAAILAVTPAVPTHAATTGPRPPAGTGDRATPGADAGSVVTLVTGDRVLVTRDGAVALPGPDGTTPFTQTRRSGDDLYVYPERAIEALAAGRVDEELFNVTGLVRQGYDDTHRATLPLIATYDRSVARTVPPTPRGAERGPVLDAIDGSRWRPTRRRPPTSGRTSPAPLPRGRRSEEAVARRQGPGHAGPFDPPGARPRGVGRRL